MAKLLIVSILLVSCLIPEVALASETSVRDADKVLILMLFDENCKKWCPKVRPILSELKTQYGDRIAVHELDVTQSVLKTSSETAKELGVYPFLKGALDYVPLVGVFTKKRQLVKELSGLKTKETYNKFVEKALGSG
jgi:thiol-disulfide isomerase/thioredoxin